MPRGRSQVRFVFDAVDNASAGIGNIAESLEEVGGEDGQSGLIGGLSVGFAAAATAAAVVGAALVANAGRWLEHTNQVRRSSEALNVNIEAYSELSYAFRQFGYDAVDIDSILAELEIKTFDWRDGNVAAADAFGELNLELEEFDRLSPDEKLDEVARALADVESNSRRIGIADALLGGEDARILLDVANSLGTLTDEAAKFGVTIDQEAAEAAQRFQQRINTFEAFLEGGANRLGQATIEFITPFVEVTGEALGLFPDVTRQAMIDAATVIEDEAGNVIFQAGAVGSEAGLNLAQQFVRGIEQRFANIDWENVFNIPTGGLTDYGGGVGQGQDNDFLIRSGLFVPGLDGAQPRRGSNAIGAGVDDVTRQLISGWVAAQTQIAASGGVSQFPENGPSDLNGGGGPVGSGGLAGLEGIFRVPSYDRDRDIASGGSGSNAAVQLSPGERLQQQLAAIAGESNRPGVAPERLNALVLEYQRLQDELSYIEGGGNPDLYGIQAADEEFRLDADGTSRAAYIPEPEFERASSGGRGSSSRGSGSRGASYGGGGGRSGGAQINLSVYFNFGEGVIAQEQILGDGSNWV